MILRVSNCWDGKFYSVGIDTFGDNQFTLFRYDNLERAKKVAEKLRKVIDEIFLEDNQKAES